MRPYLLDANVVIALVVAEHVHHGAAHTWLSGVERVALSPIVEGALIRYLVRVGVPARGIGGLLHAVYDSPKVEFWPDDVPFAAVDLAHVVGHRQVTDSYLAALAVHHGGVLATFDRALAEALPDSTELIPEESEPGR
jgi:toxin-antitoxin system PIN domain toxin